MAALEDNELRRAVAEAQGWRMVDSGAAWELFKPGGKGWIERYPHAAYTLQQAWDDAYSLHYIIPDYETDLNTVATMPLPENSFLELTLYGDGSAAAIITVFDETGQVAWVRHGRHKLLATAAWNVWLALPEDVRKAAIARWHSLKGANDMTYTYVYLRYGETLQTDFETLEEVLWDASRHLEHDAAYPVEVLKNGEVLERDGIKLTNRGGFPSRKGSCPFLDAIHEWEVANGVRDTDDTE